MIRGFARFGWAAAAAVAVSATVVASAAAHSALLRSDPADGAVLGAAPPEIVLEFSEAPDPDLSRVEVLDQTGQQVEHDDAVPDAGDGAVMRVPVSGLEDGVYTVSWRALSSVDGHVTTGAFSFTVGESSGTGAAPVGEAAATEHGEVALLGVAGRWIFYVGLVLLMGWAGSVLFVRARPAGRPWALIVCCLVAAVGLAMVTASEAASIDASVAELLGSAAGGRLVRTAAWLGVLTLVAAAAVARPSPVGAAGVAALTPVVMLSHVAAGHAGAPGSTQMLNLASQWLHFCFIGLWIGGLAWLLVAARDPSGPPPGAAVRRFSLLATVSVGVVVVTGTFRALDAIGLDRLDDLVNTAYGRLILIKLAVVVPLVALGSLNRFVNVPAILRGEGHHRRLRHTVRGEVLFAAGVVAVTGILASTPPPHDADDHADVAEEAPGGIVVTESDFATTVEVTLTLVPGDVGENRFTVDLADYDTGEPVDAVRVALRLAIPDRPDIGPSMLELEPAGPGSWEAEATAIAQPARWRATAVITYAADGVEVPLEFEVPAAGEPASPSPAHDH